MAFWNKQKKENKNEMESSSRNKYILNINSHLYGDEDEEDAKNNIINDIKNEDPSAIITIDYSVDPEMKAAVAGDEDEMFPITLSISVDTTLSREDVIACISGNVFDLDIADENGNTIYKEESTENDW